MREHEQELKSSGILSLSLLNVAGLQNRLADILGVPADLGQTRMLNPDVRERAKHEAVLVLVKLPASSFRDMRCHP